MISNGVNVLMLSTDKSILDPSSSAGKRLESYRTFANIEVLLVGRNIFRALREGRSILERFKPDIVSGQDPFFVGLVALRLARYSGARLQVQIHTDFRNPAYIFESIRHVIEFMVAWLIVIPRASRIRVVSKRIQRSVGRAADVLPIRAGYPSDGPVEIPMRPFILAVSRLAPEKRIELIIDALAEVPELSLIIVGDGKKRAALKRRARQRGVASRVHFAGFQKALAQYYKQASAFVSMSRYEGYGLSLMEAALSGCPIITTDVGLVGDVLKKEDVLVVSGSSASLVQALKKHLKDGTAARERAERADRAAASRLMTEQQYLAKYKELLEKCLA